MDEYPSGVFIIDPRGIYTPIDNGDCSIIHVERLPIVKSAVYGLTDLNKSVVLFDDRGERILIFQGVFQMEGYGWRFIDNSFQVKPIAGIATTTVRRMFHLRDGSELKAEEVIVAEAGDEDFEEGLL